MRSVLVLGAAGRSPRGEMPAVVPRSLCAMGFAIVVGAWLLGCASAASASASASAGSASGRVAQCEPGDPGARLDRRCEVGDKPPPGIALGASSSGSGQTTQGGAGAARREPFKAPPPGPLPGGGYLQLGAPADRRAVATVQRRLGRVGFAVRRDGIYGPQTASAVRRFQIARRLLVDAIVGRQTAAALRYYARTPAPPAQARPPRAGVGATAQRRTRILRAVAATKNRVTFDTRALDADRIVSATLRSGPSKWPITGPRLRRAARSGHVDITIIRRAGKRAAVVAAARAPKAARRPTRAILRRSKLHVIIATPPRRPTPPDDPDANADPGRAPSPADPGQAAPGQAAPGQAAPGQAAPGQADPGQADPGQADPGQADPGQAAPGQAAPPPPPAPPAAPAQAPAPTREVLFGAFTPNDPYGGRTDDTDALQAAIGRRVETVLWYQNWGGGEWISKVQPHLPQSVVSSGRTPLVTWEPWDPANASADQPRFALRRIADGEFDAYITSWATALRDLATTIYLRPMHEMNGNWYPWGGTVNGNSPALFVKAWRRMHDIFAQHGATNVRWVWAPNNVDVPQTTNNRMEDYYPGDNYVDILGVDGYNWGTGIPGWAGWESFTEVFATSLQRLRRLGPQPIWITEVATSPQGGDKSAWIRDMFKTAPSMERLERIIWFNEDKERDWRAAPSPEVAAAFRP